MSIPNIEDVKISNWAVNHNTLSSIIPKGGSIKAQKPIIIEEKKLTTA